LVLTLDGLLFAKFNFSLFYIDDSQGSLKV